MKLAQIPTNTHNSHSHTTTRHPAPKHSAQRMTKPPKCGSPNQVITTRRCTPTGLGFHPIKSPNNHAETRSANQNHAVRRMRNTHTHTPTTPKPRAVPTPGCLRTDETCSTTAHIKQP